MLVTFCRRIEASSFRGFVLVPRQRVGRAVFAVNIFDFSVRNFGQFNDFYITIGLQRSSRTLHINKIRS